MVALLPFAGPAHDHLAVRRPGRPPHRKPFSPLPRGYRSFSGAVDSGNQQKIFTSAHVETYKCESISARRESDGTIHAFLDFSGRTARQSDLIEHAGLVPLTRCEIEITGKSRKAWIVPSLSLLAEIDSHLYV